MTYTVNTPLNKLREDVSAAALQKAVLQNKPNSPLGSEEAIQAIMDACHKYNVDQVYITAHAALESAWGTSRFARERNNFFGFGAYDSNPDNAWAWDSVRKAVDYVVGYIAKEYLSPSGKWYGGAPSLKGMNVRYATAGHWAFSIATIANQIEAKLSKMTHQPVPTTGPDHQLYDHERTITVTPERGVNVRTEPTTTGRNVTTAFPQGADIKVKGFVRGEQIDCNDLWWETEDDLYVWSGATSYIPTLLAGEDPKPVGGLTIEELREEAVKLNDQVEEAVKRNEALHEKNEALLDQLEQSESENSEYQRQLTNFQALKDANRELGKLVETLKNGREQLLADEFSEWDLTQVEKGPKAMAKLLIAIGKVAALGPLTLKHDFVIGIKKDGRIRKL